MKRMWLWIFIAVFGMGLLLAGCQAVRDFKLIPGLGGERLTNQTVNRLISTPKEVASRDNSALEALV